MGLGWAQGGLKVRFGSISGGFGVGLGWFGVWGIRVALG